MDALDLNSIAKEFAPANVSTDILIFLDHIQIYLHAVTNFILLSHFLFITLISL